MRTLGALCAMGLFGVYSHTGNAQQDPQADDPGCKKVTICHNNVQTIEVCESAQPAHEGHGDSLGACATTNGGDEATWSSNVTSWDGKISAGRVAIGELKKAATKDQDMTRLDCLVQKEGEFEAAAKDFPADKSAFEKAAGEDKKFLYSKLELEWNNASTALKEAELCAGDDAQYVGSTQVKVKTDDNVKKANDGTDDTGFKTKNRPISRPGLASPFQTN